MPLKKLFLSMVLLIFGLSHTFAQRTITGTVISADDNLGVPGATVVVKGSSPIIGTATDFNGRYTISVPAHYTTLVFTSTGMATQEMDILGSTTIDVVMKSNITNLDAVVVIGYGSQTKKELTGSIASLGQDDFNKGVQSNALGLIQGKVAGLTIIKNGGDDPAQNSYQVQLRGLGSLRGGGSPLFVIDGVAGGDLSTVPAEDIESIDVL
ncbi:MAG: carboxypeptidase-like regulatory domain-containing protein, partial [Bacteroidales bacterium]|nr:carboxypeptidase-like regulatory domain-containing protein [Bacteroidales bacterium]